MPVETKVTAATVASMLTGLVMTLLATLAFHGDAVPAVVSSVVGAVITGVVTFAAGWLAKHTPRLLETVDNGGVSTPTTAPASTSSATPPADLPVTPPSTPPTTPPSTPGGV